MAERAFYVYTNDGDLKRGFPFYWKPFKRLLELLDSDRWEVIGWAALAISALCHAPFYCEGVPQVGHMTQFCKLGALEKLIGLLSHPPAKRPPSFYSQDHAQTEVAYALTALLKNHSILEGLTGVSKKVLNAPGIIPRLLELGVCPERDGEVQRVALLNLVAIAELSPETAQAVLNAGGKELAQKAMKHPLSRPEQNMDQETKQQAAELLRILKATESSTSAQKVPSVPTSRTPAPDTPSLEAVNGMCVKELKALLEEHGVDHQGCLEKADLQKKARALVAPERGAAGSSSGGGASVGNASAPGSASVADMSTKEIREKLTQLNVSTTGCIERQDLVDRLTSAMQNQGADPDYAPTLEQGLGPPPDAPAVAAMFSAFFEVMLKDEVLRERRAIAERVTDRNIREGKLPEGCTFEVNMRRMVDGRFAAERLLGLEMVTEFIEGVTSNAILREIADTGLLKATVRLLQDSDPGIRLGALDLLTMFVRTPLLSPKVWSYGALEGVLRELSRPAVVAAMKARNPDVVGRSRTLCAPILASLCLLGNMLIPAHMEGDFEREMRGIDGTPVYSTAQGFEDDFTAKMGRWMLKHGVLEKIGRLMTIIRLAKWKGSWERVPGNGIPSQALRVLLPVLMQSEKLAVKVIALPGLAESLVYLVEQWATATAEASSAAVILSQIHTIKGNLTEFCTRDEIMRTVKAIRASLKHLSSAPHHVADRSREGLALRLEENIRGWPYPPPIALPKFWLERLREAPDTDEAERIVNNILGHTETLPPMVNDKQLYEIEFWPLLAKVAMRASPDRRHLLITFSDAFDMYPGFGGSRWSPG